MNDGSVTQVVLSFGGRIATMSAMNVTHSSFAGLDLLASAVLLIDDELAIRYINAAGENLLAVSSRAVIGKRLTAICTCSATLQSALDNGLNSNWGYTGQNVELKRSDGEVLNINCTVTPLRPDLAPGVRLLLELQPIQHHLAATREERLIEQQQVSRELIRNLAHEIKNPLGGIRGAAQLLEHELAHLANSPSLKEYTQVIIKEADRLQDLMQRLLTPHRSMLPTTVNIHEILERVRSLLTAEFPGSLSIRRDYDTSLPELVGDREQLIQAVLNIARNAAQAMGGEGEIVLRTRSLRQVTLAKKRYRLAMEIKVIDNGPGIPEEIRERMFYPLVSGREGGSGLGLTIAQNFIQHHHGTINCVSRPGHTVFTMNLPVEQA
jgi:two-component system, NtrC family, nitrogen regulation sensor histidine kinase GlnL